jgi:cysteine desulfurase
VVQDIAAISAVVKQECGPDALLHVDAVSMIGRAEVSFAATGADYMTISAHKIGGPQGAGALILRDGAPLSAQILGGGQELGRRAGTENVAAIAGFGAAAGEGGDAHDLRSLRERFETGLKALAPDVVIFGAAAERLPNTTNFAIPGLQSETALIALDLDGIAVSTGAACSSGKVKPSHVLAAMGVEENLARCGVRVSFGWTNSARDADAAIASLGRLLARRAALAA